MLKNRLLNLFFIFFVLTGYNFSQIDSLNNEEKKVLERIHNYYQSFSDRDWDKFDDHFWKDAIISTIWQPTENDTLQVFVSSIPEFIEQAPKGPGSKEIFEEKMTDYEIKVFNNVATVWANYQAKFGNPGEIMEWSGIDVITLLKLNDDWKIVSIAFSNE